MANIKIFNTLSKETEEFVPIEPGKVRFYHCGPTVYWTPQLGNSRAMILGDLIRRTFEYLGYDVTYVRNYTDVGHLTGDNIGDADTGEDRMEKGAKREGLTPDQIADKYIKIFEDMLNDLNIEEASYKPRATEYIIAMQEMVVTLLKKGFAYITPKAVYFDVSRFPTYTNLNRQKLDLNESGAGKGDVSDLMKRNHHDFALWFFKTGVHANALQTWPSPFESAEVNNGEGFPGWHIECSAMSKALLGDTLDLHMGGIEHVSIHHTNEIAQSEAANGVKFVNYWLHNEHLLIDGEKMSKSLGNVYTVTDLIEKGYDPIVFRFFTLMAHYRSKQNFTWENMSSARTGFEKLLKQINNWQKSVENDEKGSELELWRMKFVEAIEADFNFPAALAVVWDLSKSDATPADKLATILDFDRVLGLDLLIKADKYSEFQTTLQEVSQKQFSATEIAEIEELINKRNQARSDKNWAIADQVRDQLKDKYNIELKDVAGKTEWSVINN